MPNHFILKLYVAGMTPAAKRAIANLERACEKISNGHTYEIEIVDIHEHPKLAEKERILATPTVIKELPQPVRRIVGDLSDREQLLLGLDLVEY